MTIEEVLFEKHHPVFAKLTAAGFTENDHGYQLEQDFMDGQFHAIITVNKAGQVSGNVIDNGTGDEYMPLRAIHCGPFAAQVKAAYIDLLKKIAQQCFVTEYFHSDQANRLAAWISQTFHEQPEFVFKRLPDYAVFREPQSQKWYGLVMHIPRARLTNKKATSTNDKVDVIDLRCSSQQRTALLKRKGIQAGYHMHRKSWISVTLDGTLPDADLFKLVRASRQLLANPRAWIVPANQKYYDIMHAFIDNDTITWKQSTNIRVGDIAYMYVAAPVKAIIYRCRVVEINIPYHHDSPELKIKQVMRLKLEKEYDHDQFTLDFIRQHGVSNVQGPRHVPEALLKLLEK